VTGVYDFRRFVSLHRPLPDYVKILLELGERVIYAFAKAPVTINLTPTIAQEVRKPVKVNDDF